VPDATGQATTAATPPPTRALRLSGFSPTHAQSWSGRPSSRQPSSSTQRSYALGAALGRFGQVPTSQQPAQSQPMAYSRSAHVTLNCSASPQNVDPKKWRISSQL